MKKLLGLMALLIGMHAGTSFAAKDNLCIALTNYSATAVEFDSVVSPGLGYTVEPKQTTVLSGDHMVGACLELNGLCAVSVSSVIHGGNEFVIIDHLPRGTHIVYGGAKNYYLDKDANVNCVD